MYVLLLQKCLLNQLKKYFLEHDWFFETNTISTSIGVILNRAENE